MHFFFFSLSCFLPFVLLFSLLMLANKMQRQNKKKEITNICYMNRLAFCDKANSRKNVLVWNRPNFISMTVHVTANKLVPTEAAITSITRISITCHVNCGFNFRCAHRCLSPISILIKHSTNCSQNNLSMPGAVKLHPCQGGKSL